MERKASMSWRHRARGYIYGARQRAPLLSSPHWRSPTDYHPQPHQHGLLHRQLPHRYGPSLDHALRSARFPSFNEERSVYGLSKLGGRTVANHAAVFNDEHLMNLRWDLCSCCGENTEDVCCGSNIWSCTCDDCCPGCEKEAEVKAKTRIDAFSGGKTTRGVGHESDKKAPRTSPVIEDHVSRSEAGVATHIILRAAHDIVKKAAGIRSGPTVSEIAMARAPAGDGEGIHKYDAVADLERKDDDLDFKAAAKAMRRDQTEHKTAHEAHLR